MSDPHSDRPFDVLLDSSPPSQWVGANPTLTIMASAWRVAERIADERGAA